MTESGAAKILIVEDEPKLAALLGDYFRASGYEATWIADGREVVAAVKADPPDLIVLDLMLTGSTSAASSGPSPTFRS
jgi:two-component system, OmpR family, response regulator BaeR